MGRREITEDDGAPRAVRRFARDRRGGTAIEYAMIGALIFAVVAGGIRLYGSKLSGVYTRIGDTIAQAQ